MVALDRRLARICACFLPSRVRVCGVMERVVFIGGAKLLLLPVSLTWF